MRSWFNSKLGLFQSKPNDLCSHCRKFDFEQIVDGVPRTVLAEEKHIKLGTLSQLAQRSEKCRLCRFILERALAKGFDQQDTSQICFIQTWPSSFIKWREDALINTRTKKKDPKDLLVGFTNDTNKLWGEHVTYVATLRPELQINCPDLPAPMEQFGRGRSLDDEHVDMDLCRSWVRLCKTRHAGSACETAAKMWPQHLYLVDTRKRCVVPAVEGCDYVALSYVWGTATSLNLKSLNDCDLFEPGSIDAHWGSIARTVRDAIEATSLLGFEFLWMDALCIPQEDRKVKQTLMAQMNLVYANAALTIVAAAGVDANHGLTGLYTRSGSHSQTKLSFNNLTFLTTIHGGNDRLERQRTTEWGTRAWTYEEQVFSRRQIIFTDTQVGWRCCSARWREEIVLECFDDDVEDFSGPSLVTEPQLNPQSLQKELPISEMVKFYRQAVDQYSTRQLTFPYDALNAFKGIEESFRSTSDCDFLWGIPEVAFTSSLNWTFEGAVRNNAIADWRLIKKGMSKDRHHIRLPSWSWAGWQQPRRHVKGAPRGVRYGISPFSEITWYRVGENDTFVKVEEDKSFATADGTETYWPTDGLPEQQDWIGTPQTLEAPGQQVLQKEEFVDLGLLRAWTRTCRFVLQQHAEPVHLTQRNSHSTLADQNNNIIDAKVAQSRGQGHFDISVEDSNSLFQEQNTVQVTAVSLGRNWSCDTTALLTQIHNDVHYRVGIAMIPEVIWKTLDTSWEVITLG